MHICAFEINKNKDVLYRLIAIDNCKWFYLCIGYCEFRIVVSTIGRFQFYFIFVSILGDVNCFNDVAAGPSRWSYRLEKCAYNQCSSRIKPYSDKNQRIFEILEYKDQNMINTKLMIHSFSGVFTRVWVSSIYVYSYLDIKTT